ncbi:MAG: TIGR01212 family radical SAM protein [Lachnospiraceae bacterium]|nr:TIGR01212 family radical SAM protein [Lachnospiraceae bacterium]
MYWNEKPYHSLDYDMKKRYGEKVYKIAIDAGMTCPNRDGKCGTGGCIFCSEGGSGDFAISKAAHNNIDSIKSQLEKGKSLFHTKKTGNLFIAYFQSFTNTYAPVETLDTLYREALDEPDVAGISIATRPDCLEAPVIELLDSLNKEYQDKFIWIELGLQTIHEETARLIRRGYSLDVFEEAVANLKRIHIPVIVHVILGLPHETPQMMLETCNYLNTMHIDGIKLQLLHVLKNTALAKLYEAKAFEVLDFEEYINIVIDCLEILSEDIVIHRVTGDGPRSLLIAPLWSLDKRRVLNTLHQQMKVRKTYQSIKFDSGTERRDTK